MQQKTSRRRIVVQPESGSPEVFKNQVWPEKFARIPRIGEYVLARSNKHMGQVIRVVHATHVDTNFTEKPIVFVILKEYKDASRND